MNFGKMSVEEQMNAGKKKTWKPQQYGGKRSHSGWKCTVVKDQGPQAKKQGGLLRTLDFTV
jgi:hypothetical protein